MTADVALERAAAHQGRTGQSTVEAVRPFLQLGCAAAAGLIWDQDPSRGWVLAIALAPLALPLLSRRRPLARTPLDWALALLIVSIAIGLWAGYNRAGLYPTEPWMMPPGWQWAWGLLLSLLVFYAVAAIRYRAQLAWLLWLLAGLGVAIAAWFALTNEWRIAAVEVPAIEELGDAIQARFLMPESLRGSLNPNIAGALLAMLLFCALGAALAGLRSSRAALRLLWGVGGLAAALVIAGGLILTVSRGAWAAAAVAAVLSTSLALAVWLARRARWGWAGRLGIVAVIVAMLGILAWGVLTARLGDPVALLTYAPKSGSVDRPTLYSEVLLVIRDYPFTGAGLGAFAPIHSTYVLLIAQPTMIHAHNMFLHVLAEQGVVGLIALAGGLLAAIVAGLRALGRVRAGDPLLLACLAALFAQVAHGLVDFPLCGARGILFLWLPAGLVVAAARIGEEGKVGRLEGWKTGRLLFRRRLPVLVLAALVLVLAVTFGRPLAAAWEANLGAVAQAKIELSRYDWRGAGQTTLADVRRSVDLGPAERHFRRALALNPANATALDRLAMLALARGDLDEAMAVTQAAWDAGHRDRVTRLLYSQALAATGNAALADEVKRGLRSGMER